MEKKSLFAILFLMAVFLSSSVYAAAEHGIHGYVADSEETSANGAIVVFYIDSRPDERLTDIVGTQGNSLQDNWYAIDLKNFETPWKDGEILKIMIIKGECKTAVTAVVLQNNVNEQQAPNIELVDCADSSYCEECCLCASLLGICWYVWLFMITVLVVIVYYIIKKQILDKKKLYEQESELLFKKEKKKEPRTLKKNKKQERKKI